MSIFAAASSQACPTYHRSTAPLSRSSHGFAHTDRRPAGRNVSPHPTSFWERIKCPEAPGNVTDDEPLRARPASFAVRRHWAALRRDERRLQILFQVVDRFLDHRLCNVAFFGGSSEISLTRYNHKMLEIMDQPFDGLRRGSNYRVLSPEQSRRLDGGHGDAPSAARSLLTHS